MKFNRRIEIIPTDDRLQTFVGALDKVAREMLCADPILYPVEAVRNCDVCSFDSLCALRNYGQPWDVLASANFTTDDILLDDTQTEAEEGEQEV